MRSGLSWCMPMQAVAGFDIASLDWSGMWEADYPGAAPWPAIASAGLSGSNGDLLTNSSDPTAGSPLNGHIPAAFDAISSQQLITAGDITDFVTDSASTVVALVQIVTADSGTGNTYDDAAIFRDANADYGITVKDGGFGPPSLIISCFAYDGAYQIKPITTGGYGNWYLIMMRHDGVNLGFTLNSAVEETLPCGTLLAVTGNILVGLGYGGTHNLTGNIAFLGTSKSVFSDGDYANIKTRFNTRYGLSL